MDEHSLAWRATGNWIQEVMLPGNRERAHPSRPAGKVDLMHPVRTDPVFASGCSQPRIGLALGFVT
jgi:hypothetical protein